MLIQDNKFYQAFTSLITSAAVELMRQGDNISEGTVTLLIGNLGAADLTMSKLAYRGHRFPPTIIQLTV